MLKIEVHSGQEVIETVTKFVKKENIKNAAVVSVIGALDACKLSTMPKNDAQKVIEKAYREPVELSGNGEISDGKLHLHVTLGTADQTALHGHLEWGKVKDWFVHVYIIPLE